MSTKTFKSLMNEMDDDHRLLARSDFPRTRIYYDVYLNKRKSAVVARKLKNRYSNKISFLVCVGHDLDDNHRSMLYLTDLDIIETLSGLGEESFSKISDFLLRCGIGNEPTEHSVILRRQELYKGLSLVELRANKDVLLLSSNKPNLEIQTPYGVTVKIVSLCDLISLILSSENSSKRKIIATKYYVLSHMVRGAGNSDLPNDSELEGLHNMKAVRGLYDSKKTMEDENIFDHTVFGNIIYGEYFKSLT